MSFSTDNLNVSSVVLGTMLLNCQRKENSQGYETEDQETVVKKVKKYRFPIRKAAKTYNIPLKTSALGSSTEFNYF